MLNPATKSRLEAKEEAYIFDKHEFIMMDISKYIGHNQRLKILIFEMNYFLREITAKICFKMIKVFDIKIHCIEDSVVEAIFRHYSSVYEQPDIK